MSGVIDGMPSAEVDDTVDMLSQHSFDGMGLEGLPVHNHHFDTGVSFHDTSYQRAWQGASHPRQGKHSHLSSLKLGCLAPSFSLIPQRVQALRERRRYVPNSGFARTSVARLAS